MKGLNEGELVRLHKLISELQWHIFQRGDGVNAVTTSMLVNSLVEAQGQTASVERELKSEDEENHRKEQQEKSTMRFVIEQEAALNSEERREYAGFLRKEFFTKSDFHSLAHFYAHSWDKLTESGKEQMSHRLWGGIRHGEYTFQELPEVVKEKESEGLYEQLRESKKASPELMAIPLEDRNAFLNAWKNKDCSKAYEILDRPSFKENVAKGVPQNVKSESAAVVKTEAAERLIQIEKREENTSKKPDSGNVIGKVDLKLDDLKLVDSGSAPITSPLPGGGSARTR